MAASSIGGGTVTVTGSTFSGNSAGAYGGGISNFRGTVTVARSTFSGNSAGYGGGISSSYGTLTVTNSTFSGNGAGHYGGAIFNDNLTDSFPTGMASITNSTLSGNAASISGGGIGNNGSLTLTNSLIANTTSGGNCAITDVSNGYYPPADVVAIDGGHNIDDGATCGFSTANGSLNNTNPKLDPAGLVNNGGPTKTIALQAGSPAINAGDENICSTTTGTAPVDNFDQRGFVRPRTGAANCSVGAFEANSVAPTATPTPTVTNAAGKCVGDCSGDETVSVNELITMVNIALGTVQLSTCPVADANGDGEITVNEIINAVNNALNGCPQLPTPTPPLPPSATSTTTSTNTTTPTVTSTATPSATSTSTFSATATVTASPTPSATSTATNTNTPTQTNTLTVTPTPTSTPTKTPSPTATATPTPTVTQTFAPTPTATPTNTLTETPTETPTQTPTDTPTDTPTQTPNPQPALNGVVPAVIAAHSPLSMVTLSGENFIPASQVTIGGAAVPTTYLSPTELTATLPESSLTSPGILQLTVTNPSPGGGTSSEAALSVVSVASFVVIALPTDPTQPSAQWAITASTLDDSGAPISGLPVTLNSTAGSIAAPNGTTNEIGAYSSVLTAPTGAEAAQVASVTAVTGTQTTAISISFAPSAGSKAAATAATYVRRHSSIAISAAQAPAPYDAVVTFGISAPAGSPNPFTLPENQPCALVGTFAYAGTTPSGVPYEDACRGFTATPSEFEKALCATIDCFQYSKDAGACLGIGSLPLVCTGVAGAGGTRNAVTCAIGVSIGSIAPDPIACAQELVSLLNRRVFNNNKVINIGLDALSAGAATLTCPAGDVPSCTDVAALVCDINLPSSQDGPCGIGTSSEKAPSISNYRPALPAREEWYPTGISISAGDAVMISASGPVNIGVASGITNASYMPPSGDPDTTTSAQSGSDPDQFAAPGLIPWSLVAKVGASGTPFQVGPVRQCISDTSGTLLLSVNDNEAHLQSEWVVFEQ